MTELNTDHWGPWFAEIRPQENGMGFLIMLKCEKSDAYPIRTALNEIREGVDPIPWEASTMREAKKIARRELRGKRKREKTAIKRSSMNITIIH